MLCPCDNITGYLNGLQYLFRLLAGIASGTFLFALSPSHALSLLSPSSPSLLLRYPCSYTILALTPSLLLRHPCSYAILALTLSLLLRHPCSYAILALTPSSLLQHPCSHAILALTTSLLFDILAPNPHFLSSHLFSLLSLPTCSVSFLFLICLRQLPLINLNNLWSLSRCLSCGYIIDPYIVDLSLR